MTSPASNVVPAATGWNAPPALDTWARPKSPRNSAFGVPTAPKIAPLDRIKAGRKAFVRDRKKDRVVRMRASLPKTGHRFQPSSDANYRDFRIWLTRAGARENGKPRR